MLIILFFLIHYVHCFINGDFSKILSNGWIIDSNTLGNPIITNKGYLKIGDVEKDISINGTSSVYQDFMLPNCNVKLSFLFSGTTKDITGNDFQVVRILDTDNKVLAILFNTLYKFEMNIYEPPWIFQIYNLCEYNITSKLIRLQFLVQGNGNQKGTSMFIDDIKII